MKKLLLLYGIIFTLCLSGFSQNGEKIQALKIAYLTRQMNLTPGEAERFWPVYNQYTEEIRQTRINAIGNKEDEIVTEEKIVNIRKKYNSEFARALPPEKVNLFFRAEREFGASVQKEIIQRRQLRMQQRRPLLR
jgi:hypothetical protein